MSVEDVEIIEIAEKGDPGASYPALSQAQVENSADVTFGVVSGLRLFQAISAFIAVVRSYLISGTLEVAASKIVLAPNDDIDLTGDHYQLFELPASGTTNFGFTALPLNRSTYRNIRIKSGSLAGVTLTANPAVDLDGAAFDIAAWLGDNLIENDWTRIIMLQVGVDDGAGGVDQLVELTLVVP